jgi:hypothetical protein
MLQQAIPIFLSIVRRRATWAVIFVTAGFGLLVLQWGYNIFGPLIKSNRDSMILTLGLLTTVALGFALTIKNTRKSLTIFFAFLGFNVAWALAIGQLGFANDVAVGTSFEEADQFFTLSAISNLTEEAVGLGILVKVLVNVVPIAILVAGAVLVWMADSPDETQTAIIDTIIIIVLFIIAQALFGILGVDLFA